MSVNVSPFKVAAAPTLPPSIRAEGRLVLAVKMAGRRHAVDRIEESGPLRIRFPRMRDDDRLEGVLINTAGGIAGGDRLSYEIETAENTSLAITSQAAEKIYRSSGDTARIDVKLKAGRGSRLSWVPQETILFDRVKVKRTLSAEIAPGAEVTICESVVFGRAAMGEEVAFGAFEDCWRISRGGKLIFADTVRMNGKIGSMLTQQAIGAGNPCIATILQISPEAEARIDAARAALEDTDAGASAFGGTLVVRMIAPGSFALRRVVLNVLSAIGAPPPRAFTL
jgi:urease accessory protein